MGEKFNAEEVLEMASQVEREGARFYRRLAERSNSEEARGLFIELAEMEEDHEIIFENMRAEPDVLVELLGDPEGEAALYLRALASGAVFPMIDESTNLGLENLKLHGALKMALNLEFISIAFYQGVCRVIKSDADRKKVEAIIGEEMQHVTRLAGLLHPSAPSR